MGAKAGDFDWIARHSSSSAAVTYPASKAIWPSRFALDSFIPCPDSTPEKPGALLQV